MSLIRQQVVITTLLSTANAFYTLQCFPLMIAVSTVNIKHLKQKQPTHSVRCGANNGLPLLIIPKVNNMYHTSLYHLIARVCLFLA